MKKKRFWEKDTSVAEKKDTEKVVSNSTPLFGTYCRSIGFKQKDMPDGAYDYLEMFQDNERDDIWCIQRISVMPVLNDKLIDGRITRNDLTFKKALYKLVEFEISGHAEEVMEPAGETLEELGFKHFIAFSEREGYYYSNYNKKIYERSEGSDNPINGKAFESDIKRANECWNTANKDMQPAPSPMMAAKNKMLSELFRRASSKANLEDVLKSKDTIEAVDGFVLVIERSLKDLNEYIDVYQELGKGEYIIDALKRLDMASEQLKPIRKHGLDTKEFEHFVDLCKVTCHVINCQALFDIIDKELYSHYDGAGSNADQKKRNTNDLKEKLQEAKKLYKKIGGTTEELQILEASVVQGGKPKIPDTYTNFLKNYKKRKRELEQRVKKGMPLTPNSLIPPVPHKKRMK